MRILVLGAAAGGGYPQWNCNTPGSQRAWRQEPGHQRRTQASIAVSADNERWLLINASPDFRQQILAQPALWPKRDLRHSPIEAVLLTSGEIDHIAGLLSMRERQRFDLWASARVLDVLDQNPIFESLHPDYVARKALTLDTPIDVAGHDAPLGLQVTPFSVPGKVPLFMESRANGNLQGGDEETVGLEISDGRERFFYIPGCAAMTDDLRRRLHGASLVLFDGTLWRDDEMVRAGVGSKTGARMGHMNIAGDGGDDGGTLAAFAPLDVRRKLFIHLNTTNPLLDDHSPERAQARAHGWEVAEDGMELQL